MCNALDINVFSLMFKNVYIGPKIKVIKVNSIESKKTFFF